MCNNMTCRYKSKPRRKCNYLDNQGNMRYHLYNTNCLSKEGHNEQAMVSL